MIRPGRRWYSATARHWPRPVTRFAFSCWAKARWQQCVDLGVAIEVCDACRIARGITDDDLAGFSSTIGSPATLVAGIEWADKVIAE